MIKHGVAPFLECSSRGDKRFSALFARPYPLADNMTIEEIYQGAKVFDGGITHLNWREAKGRKALNQEAVSMLYSILWNDYIVRNPHLLIVLKQASGLSDVFGKQGSACQATELWRIRRER